MKNYGVFFLMLILLSFSYSAISQSGSQSQTPPVIADFTMPDTVCREVDVDITNLSQGASTYFWKFCTGDPLTDMRGVDLGNPSGFLQVPLGVSLVQDNGNFYAFITNAGNGTITKISYGNSLLNPVTAENLGNFGMLTNDIFGIQVKYDLGAWYGFVTNGNQLIRLDLGPTLSVDIPTARVIATSAFMNKSHGLTMEKDGNTWVGFCTNYPGKTITRFIWDQGLNKNPTVDDLGNVGGLTEPMQPALIRDNNAWFLFVTNTTSLVMLEFGTSLKSVPTGTNLGNLGWLTDDRGISLFMECNHPYGFITNHNLVDNLILQINFQNGILGNKSINPLGTAANLYLPCALSESINLTDTIYTVALNESSMTTLYFPPCLNSPLPSSTLFNPSPIKFNSPGKYTVKLTVDMGLATEQTVCREIYIDATPPVHLGNDTTLCAGTSLKLDAGSGFTNYAWNTGESTRIIDVSDAGKYSVYASKQTGCHSEDTIQIYIAQPGAVTIDTAICYGKRYFAGGNWQTKAGIYYDTLYTNYLCDSIKTTNLTVKPEVIVTLGNDTCIFSNQSIQLQAIANGPATFTWHDGSSGPIYTATVPGKYWVTADINECSGADTMLIKACPALIFFPSAFSPNGDGLNDYFQPKGTDIRDFHMIIFDRWGTVVFETSDPANGWPGTINNEYAEPGVYTFMASYKDPDSTGEFKKITGNLTLVR
jgi:gliding motility-associated-like protein